MLQAIAHDEVVVQIAGWVDPFATLLGEVYLAEK